MKMAEAKRGLALLKESGMQKINFSGGEPFLFKRFLGELVKYCKQTLCLESVSIVSNGSLIDEQWMDKFGPFLDILAVSCDSFNPDVLRSMGRCTKTGETDHIEQTKRVRDWCELYNVAFKMNTVVTAHNVDENICEQVRMLRPKRWKVFQVLPIEGENVGSNPTSRDVHKLEITQEAFDSYIERHRLDTFVEQVIVPEDNAHMRDSYLILDQRMRFLDCTGGGKVPSASILDVGGVTAALSQAGHDLAMFHDRGGMYAWRKEDLLDVEDMGKSSVLPPCSELEGEARRREENERGQRKENRRLGFQAGLELAAKKDAWLMQMCYGSWVEFVSDSELEREARRREENERGAPPAPPPPASASASASKLKPPAPPASSKSKPPAPPPWAAAKEAAPPAEAKPAEEAKPVPWAATKEAAPPAEAKPTEEAKPVPWAAAKEAAPPAE